MSLPGCVIVAVGGIVASIGQILPRKIVGPPSIVRNGPPSGLKNLLNETTSKKKGQITIMLSLVPKSKFLKFPQPLHYKKGTTYLEATVQSNIQKN